MILHRSQLGDFTSDLNAALAARMPKQSLPTITNTRTKTTPGTVVKKALKSAPKTTAAIATVPANLSTDELIAGARLQWSVMLGISRSFYQETSATRFLELADALRRSIANAGLQQVQVTTASYETWAINKLYPGKFVVEVTTPINRRQKADLHWDLEQLATSVGLTVDPNPAHNNLALIKQGANGKQGGLKAEPYQTNPNSNQQPDGLNTFLGALGLSTPWAVLAGAAIFIAILKR